MHLISFFTMHVANSLRELRQGCVFRKFDVSHMHISYRLPRAISPFEQWTLSPKPFLSRMYRGTIRKDVSLMLYSAQDAPR